jgi:hypothetical protein
MAANECSSKSRAFILLDSSAMSPGCLLWTQAALTRLGNTLAVSLAQPPPLGVAVMVNKPGQAAQLQVRCSCGVAGAGAGLGAVAVGGCAGCTATPRAHPPSCPAQILLRLGGGERAFQVREFLACVKRLQAGSSASACTATDGNMMGAFGAVAALHHACMEASGRMPCAWCSCAAPLTRRCAVLCCAAL